MASKAMDAQDRKWQAESDANTLAEAGIIRTDRGRMAGAKKAAKRMAAEQKKRADNLASIGDYKEVNIALKR